MAELTMRDMVGTLEKLGLTIQAAAVRRHFQEACNHPVDEVVYVNSDDLPREFYDGTGKVPYIPCSTVMACWACEQVIKQVSEEPFENWWPKNKERLGVEE